MDVSHASTAWQGNLGTISRKGWTCHLDDHFGGAIAIALCPYVLYRAVRRCHFHRLRGVCVGLGHGPRLGSTMGQTARCDIHTDPRLLGGVTGKPPPPGDTAPPRPAPTAPRAARRVWWHPLRRRGLSRPHLCGHASARSGRGGGRHGCGGAALSLAAGCSTLQQATCLPVPPLEARRRLRDGGSHGGCADGLGNAVVEGHTAPGCSRAPRPSPPDGAGGTAAAHVDAPTAPPMPLFPAPPTSPPTAGARPPRRRRATVSAAAVAAVAAAPATRHAATAGRRARRPPLTTCCARG